MVLVNATVDAVSYLQRIPPPTPQDDTCPEPDEFSQGPWLEMLEDLDMSGRRTPVVHCMKSQQYDLKLVRSLASYPVPHPAFRHLQYKLGVGLGTRLSEVIIIIGKTSYRCNPGIWYYLCCILLLCRCILFYAPAVQHLQCLEAGNATHAKQQYTCTISLILRLWPTSLGMRLQYHNTLLCILLPSFSGIVQTTSRW